MIKSTYTQSVQCIDRSSTLRTTKIDASKKYIFYNYSHKMTLWGKIKGLKYQKDIIQRKANTLSYNIQRIHL